MTSKVYFLKIAIAGFINVAGIFGLAWFLEPCLNDACDPSLVGTVIAGVSLIIALYAADVLIKPDTSGTVRRRPFGAVIFLIVTAAAFAFAKLALPIVEFGELLSTSLTVGPALTMGFVAWKEYSQLLASRAD